MRPLRTVSAQPPDFPAYHRVRNLLLGSSLMAGLALAGCTEPPQEGKPTPKHLRDKDGDGIPDVQDECPEKYGDKSADGCPQPRNLRKKGLVSFPSKPATPPDPGKEPPMQPSGSGAEPAGAPGAPGPMSPQVLVKDSDGDGVPDAKDRCPAKKGTAANHGCPTGILPKHPRPRLKGRPAPPRRPMGSYPSVLHPGGHGMDGTEDL